MNHYPQSPSEWKSPEYTLFRTFEFRSAPDIEVLIRLVQKHIPDQGNHQYLKARLLGILYSKQSQANAEFWIKQKYPVSWQLRVWARDLRQWVHRTFNTRYFRNYVELSKMVDEVINELQ